MLNVLPIVVGWVRKYESIPSRIELAGTGEDVVAWGEEMEGR